MRFPLPGDTCSSATLFEGLATDTAKEIIQTSDAISHERTQQVFRLLIKRFPEYLQHAQDNMAIDAPVMQYLADLTDLIVNINHATSSAPGLSSRVCPTFDTPGSSAM
jgi:hypothetical protein